MNRNHGPMNGRNQMLEHEMYPDVSGWDELLAVHGE